MPLITGYSKYKLGMEWGRIEDREGEGLRGEGAWSGHSRPISTPSCDLMISQIFFLFFFLSSFLVIYSSDFRVLFPCFFYLFVYFFTCSLFRVDTFLFFFYIMFVFSSFF